MIRLESGSGNVHLSKGIKVALLDSERNYPFFHWRIFDQLFLIRCTQRPTESARQMHLCSVFYIRGLSESNPKIPTENEPIGLIHVSLLRRLCIRQLLHAI